MTIDIDAIKRMAEAGKFVPASATFDEVVNDLAWNMHSYLVSHGAVFDGRVFNSMKSFLRDTISEWVARSEIAAARSAVPELIARVERLEAALEWIADNPGAHHMNMNGVAKRRPREPAMTKPVAWECFRDAGYFDMWCVRKVGSTDFGDGFHVMSEEEAEALSAALARAEKAEAEVERLREAALSLSRLLLPIHLGIAKYDYSGDPVPDDAIILQYDGDGCSERVSAGEYRTAMSQLHTALGDAA